MGVKFYYNARGSFIESNDHWIELLKEREKVTDEEYKEYKKIAEVLSLKLNNFIAATYKAKTNNK